ncbi:DUF4192 domain-containing protein [Propionibacteriaceae bacterium Y1923]
MTQPITARSATDLLSLVPYLLGFHLDRGLVVLVCTGRSVELTMRFDLEMFSDNPVQVQARFCHLAARFEHPRFFLAAYSADRDEAESALAILEQVLELDEVIESVYTDGEHWWSRLCDKECCQRVPCDTATAAVASAVLAGSSALGSRAELERSVQGPSLVVQSQLLGAYAEASDRAAELPDVLDRCDRVAELVTTGLEQAGLGEVEACELAKLVDQVGPRDEAWLLMQRPTARRHAALWHQVVGLVPDKWAVPPLCLLAAAAWLDGNGALMGCALDRAHQLNPDYSMLGLLEQMRVAAVHPSMWEQIWPDSA